MNRLFSAKPLLAAAVALGAIGAATTAQARTDVVFGVNLGIPAYVEPAPVYVQPQPVYVQPRVEYYGYNDRYAHDWRWREARRVEYRHHGWRDSDHDGVPDRFDARPYNPYRR
jgi:hypothetical protein